MSRTLRPARHHRVRCRPRLERLESLQLLDAGLGNLAVLSTTPANGATLSQSPTDLIVQFNQPFKQPSSPRSPLFRSPLLRSPLLRSPLLRSPLLRSPLLRSPLLRSPLPRVR